MTTQTFQISCESTADLPHSYLTGRGVSVLFYTYSIDGVEHEDNMGRDTHAMEDFFAQLQAGKMPVTSQINTYRYEEYFEALLQTGDVLHICFGTGMTPSYRNALEAAENLRQKYPQRKIAVVDSLCSCTGYGMLVDTAADLRDAGRSLNETEQWLLANRNRVHHQFFCTDLTQFKRSGRVSGPVALVGSILGICPIMRLNSEGRIIAYGKVRGKKNAIRTTMEEMAAHIQDGKNYRGKLYVCHSNCPELCQEVVEAIGQTMGFPAEQIRTGNIGAVISAHCGPGTVAVFFFGDERPA